MRILQICQKPPWPPVDGGCLAMNSLNKSLSIQGHEVHLAAISSNKHPFVREALPRAQLLSYTDLHIGATYHAPAMLMTLMIGSKYVVSRFYDRRSILKLVEKLKERRWDMVILDGLYAAGALCVIRNHTRAPILLRAHNVEYGIWRQRSDREKGMKRLLFKRVASILHKHEVAIVRKCDAVAALSELDAEQLNLDSGRRIHQLGIAIDAAKLKPMTGRNNAVVFLGAMDWPPNREGLQWLITTVWPLVTKVLPDAHLHVAGREMDVFMKGKETHGIVNCGTVSDARSFIADFPVMAVPLFTGSGIRMKILEAFAEGCAVVTTAAGFRGLDLQHGKQLLAADDADGFANAIVDLLTNANKAGKVATHAFDWLRETMGQEAVAASFSEIVREMGL